MKKDNRLVKTDYDNFRDMTFFIKQQKKANEMLREVAEFQQSFVQSKLISYNDYLKENPHYGLKFFEHLRPEWILWRRNKGPIAGYVKANCLKGCNYRPYVQLTKEEEHTVNLFYLGTDNYKLKATTLIEEPYVTSSLTGDYHPEDLSLYVFDWKRFLDADVIEDAFDKYATELSSKVELLYENAQKREDYQPWIRVSDVLIEQYRDEVAKFVPPAIDEKALLDVMYDRFGSAIKILQKCYVIDDEWKQQHFKACYPNINIDDKCWIVWNGELRFVSDTPKNYESKLNEECTEFSFIFDRHTIKDKKYHGFCQLTYSTKNNELIKYEEYL